MRQCRVSLLVPLCAITACGGSTTPTSSGSGGATTPVVSFNVPLTDGFVVTSRGAHVVFRFDATGAAQGIHFADVGLVRPVGLTFGPATLPAPVTGPAPAARYAYVAVGDSDRIARFDATTRATAGAATSGVTLRSPRNLNFGPDGALYVADGFLNQVLRFDGVTGAFDRVFATDAALNGPTSFTFGPDGDLYVVSVLTNRVLRFDGTTGAFKGPFITTGLALPHDVAFGPDGNLYVTNSGSTTIQRFQAGTGALIGPFVTDPALNAPLGLTWGPDGNLYVANQLANEIRRYDGVTGALRGVVVPGGSGGLASPAFIAFQPATGLALSATRDTTRTMVLLVARGASPGGRLLVAHGTTGGGTTAVPGCAAPVALGAATFTAWIADEGGFGVVREPVPATGAGYAVIDVRTCAISAVVQPT
ncbi:MAG: NHL repeat-containing protein [Gemmatimonadetes bacterium]|nr:NHL repeat-containing protein [Gemmatimonadota bacterium]